MDNKSSFIKKKRKIREIALSGIIKDRWIMRDCVTKEYIPSSDENVKYVISTKGNKGKEHPYHLIVYYKNNAVGLWIFKYEDEAKEFINNDGVQNAVNYHKLLFSV